MLELVGCLGFNGPLRQYFSLYRAVSQREGEIEERIDESKNVQTTPTRTYCKCNRPLPYCNRNCRTPRHWKFTQHHRTTRPPLYAGVWWSHGNVFQQISTQVHYATQPQTVLVGMVCDYVYFLFLSIPYLSFSLSPSSCFSVNGAVLAIGAGRLPPHWSLFFGRKYREKTVQHLLQAIPFFFSLHLLHRNDSPAPAAACSRGGSLFFSLSSYDLTL